jgi:excinuclease ABC subunit C
MVRSCNLIIPSPTNRKYRVCLDYYIKRCPGPCEFKITEESYGELIDSACLFLEGKEERLLASIEEKMERASEELRFEEAASWRDKLRALNSVRQKQKVSAERVVDRDVLALARADKIVAAVALQIRDGLLIGRQSFQLSADPSDSDSEVLTAFIKQYYLHSPSIPDEIFLPGPCDEEDLVTLWLGKERNKSVKIHVPQRGQKYELLEMAQTNAKLMLNEPQSSPSTYPTSARPTRWVRLSSSAMPSR